MADDNQNTEPTQTTEPTPEPTPTPSTLTDKVKLALRISHNLLDGEIADVITSARQEMVRAGVSSDVAESDKEIIEKAVKTYALAYYSTDKEAERYSESFKYQLDCIRKSEITVEGE